MTDLAVKVILTAEGAQLTSGSRVAEKDIDRVTDAARKAGVATSELATRTNTASSAMQAETRSAGQASKAINDQVESIKRLALAEAELARNKRLDAFIRRDGFDPAVIRRGAQDIVDAKNAARGELGNRASGTDVRSRAGEILEANALAKATANLGEASRGATGAQAALGGAATDTAARLGGLRGAAAGAAGQIAAAAGVSEGALASVGALGVAVGVAGAAVVGLGAIFVGGVVLAQNYQDEIKAISQELALAGNITGQTAEQFRASAAQIAADSGTALSEVEAAQLKLIGTGEFTGQQIEELTRIGAGYAVTFGVDMSDATATVAGAMSALASGDVRALDEGFGFLDATTRQTIITLVGVGDEATAQKRLIEALTASVSGSKGSASGAFGALKDATFDYIGSLLSSVGPIREVQDLLKGLGQTASEVTAKILRAIATRDGARLNNIGNDLADANDRRATFARISPNAPNPFDAQVADLTRRQREEAQRRAPQLRSVRGGSNSGLQFERDLLKQEEKQKSDFERLERDSKRQPSSGGGGGGRTARKAGKSDAEREAEKQAREAAAAVRELEQSLDGLRRAYDPVDAAQKKHAEQLSLIARLQLESAGASRMSAEQAKIFTDAANQDFDDAKRADLDALNRQYGLLGDSAAVYAKALREIAALEGRSVADGGIAKFEGDRLREAAKQEKIASDIGKIFAGRLEDAGTKGAKAFRRSGRDAVEDIAALFGDRIGSKAEGLLRILKNGGQPGGFGDGLNQLGKDIVKPLKDLFEDIFGDSGNFAKSISGAIDTVLKGIQFGTGVTNLLGVRGSKTGAGIGSLAGKGLTAATGIPGLDAVGSVIGSFIGGALKKAKTGSSSLSFDGGELGAGKAIGNSGARKRAAESATGDLAQRLSAIAEQLGGVITANAAVSIGFKNGKPVVDTEGRNRTKGAGVVKFGKDDQEGAFAFAAANAIADGVIGGLSDKVAAALRSSTDIDRAIREATKVDALESLLDGLVGGNAKALREFEAQAKDRLRIATQFGFDVVKVEAANAKERKSLITQSLDEAVGGLREILESFKTGDRATGSLSDRRDALISERDVLAQTAGTDREAADRLARVIAQIDDISLEAFGTAGGQFATDRATNTSIAQRIVDQANAEITAASAKAQGIAGTGTASTDALIKASNERLAALEGGLNELTDLTVEMVSALNAIKSNTIASVNANDPFAAARTIGGLVFKQ